MYNQNTSRTEILKAHRQHYLYTNYDMMQVPMLNSELEERFSSQVMCTYVSYFRSFQLLDPPPGQTCLRTKRWLFLCMNCK